MLVKRCVVPPVGVALRLNCSCARRTFDQYRAVYPNVSWRGILANGMIAKNKAQIEIVARRNGSA